jgi:Zn-finger nucleic acid-binding protein
MPASLNCPTCGAPAAGPDAARCEYCGSTLTTTSCPSCFGAMFVGMQFCPHCGAKGDRSVDASTAIPCPSCKGTMQRIRVGATAMLECSSCHADWLDAGTFTNLCLNREERGAIAALTAAPTGTAITGATKQVRYVPCPVCRNLMNRENFGRRSGVIVDVCKGHGVWFERNELAAVMAFIDSGGLERARVAQAEHDREQRQRDSQDLKRISLARAVLAAQEPPTSSFLDEALRLLLN